MKNGAAALTRDIALLSLTALAWLAFAVLASQPDHSAPLALDATRTAALTFSAVLLVRMLGLLVIDLGMEQVWGVPANGLVRLTIYLVLGLVAAALVLNYAFRMNLAAVLTTSALLTAILGFAMQSTLAAFFSGVALQMERHVRPGDILDMGGRTATVETIGWRSMTARGEDGAVSVIPNTEIAASTVAVRRPGEPMRQKVKVWVPLAAPPAMVAEIAAEALTAIPEIAGDQPIRVDFEGTDPKEARAEYAASFATRSGLPLESTARTRIWYAFQRHGLILESGPAMAAALSPARICTAETMPSVFAALRLSSRWKMLDPAAASRLAEGRHRMLFAPGEALFFPQLAGGSLGLVVAGTLSPGPDVNLVEAGIEPPEGGEESSAGGWSRDALLDIEARLAQSLGPYAKRAIRLATRRAGDVTEMNAHLAELIPDAAERLAFLCQAPRNQRRLGAGSVFSISDGQGYGLPGAPLSSLSHTEILVLPKHQITLPYPSKIAAE